MDNLVHVQSLQIKIRCVYAYASLLQANKLTDGAADDFQDTFHSEEKGFQKEKFCINSMLEDKICDRSSTFSTKPFGICVFRFLSWQSEEDTGSFLAVKKKKEESNMD